MKIFYWSPFISKVATVLSVVKSAESILKYSKKKEEINVALIDAIGEWKNYESKINPKIEIMVDGGMNPSTIKYVVKSGADYVISGSYLAKSDNFKQAMRELKKSLG